jgi:thioredoxin reductase
MTNRTSFDVVIVGGSYAGLAAGMALGRALRDVMIIDDGKPCNRQTPHSHNFLTQDGKTPHEISTVAKQQVAQYDTISFFNGLASAGTRTANGYVIRVSSGESFAAKKVIFATGIKDILPTISGFAECWGISVLHCPYCHGYEVKNETTGILANGDSGFDYASLISNWTKNLTLYTNGSSTLTPEQTAKLLTQKIKIVETEIEELVHVDGKLQKIIFKDGTIKSLTVVYARSAFEQHCTIPISLGCELTEDGYIKTDSMQKTNIPGIYACGDNMSRMRTVANAIALGTTAGMMVNRELIHEAF